MRARRNNKHFMIKNDNEQQKKHNNHQNQKERKGKLTKLLTARWAGSPERGKQKVRELPGS